MKIRQLLFLLVFFPLLTGCGVYSFTGASISPDVKTVSIQFFKNNATLVQPTLSRILTDALKDKFMSQTSLNLINKGGDLSFEGQITNYATQPVAIQGNETAALNRLTITINVKFTNIRNDKQNFESSFSRFQDYPSSKSLSAVESDLIKEITDVLVDDIFNRSVVNW